MSDRSSLKAFQIAGSFSGSNKDWAATKGAAYSAAQTNNVQWLLLYGGAAFKGRQLTGADELKTHANWLKHFETTVSFTMSLTSLKIKVPKTPSWNMLTRTRA